MMIATSADTGSAPRHISGRALLLSLLLCLFWSVAAGASSRYALVIGNDAYVNVPELKKARNDAKAVSGALQALGFDVTTVLDADRRALNQAISGLASRLQPGDNAVFYFAGHGVEVDGRNYLLPSDVPAARPGDEAFLTSESIAVDRVLQTVQSRGARVSLLILDACRDNPFPRQGTRSLGGTRGLARVDPPEGAFILFSAGTGQSALDRLSDEDDDPNSIFTRALLPLLQEPGLGLHEMTQRVRRDVRSLAKTVGHDQFPAYYDQLSGDFSIAGGTAPVTPPAPATVADAPVAVAEAPDPCVAARLDWQVLDSGPSPSAGVLRRYIRTHGDCPMYAALAQERVSAMNESPAATRSERPAETVALLDSRRLPPSPPATRVYIPDARALTLAVGQVRLNARGRNRALAGAAVERISNDLMVKLSQFPDFDVMERTEIDQLIDEKTFTTIAGGGSMPEALAELEGADYLVIAVIDDFLIRTETKTVPYLNELQTRYFGTVESTLRMVDVHTGRLVAADKVRLDERIRGSNDEAGALADLLDLYTSEVVHRINDNLIARQGGGSRAAARPPVAAQRPRF